MSELQERPVDSLHEGHHALCNSEVACNVLILACFYDYFGQTVIFMILWEPQVIDPVGCIQC